MMNQGKIFPSVRTPKTLPSPLAKTPYIRYFAVMGPRPYPSALCVPISVRSSSTMRVMLVSDTSAATRKNMNGRNAAINHFEDLASLYGSRENDTAETYCHRIYGYDVSPNDVVRIKAALTFANEYETSSSEEKIQGLLSDNADGVKVSEKIINSVINKY